MLAFSILLFLTGAVFAWRFRVWAIIPLSIAAFVGTYALTYDNHTSLPALGLSFACAALPQLGYLFGAISRYVLAAQRLTQVSRQRAHSSGQSR